MIEILDIRTKTADKVDFPIISMTIWWMERGENTYSNVCVKQLNNLTKGRVYYEKIYLCKLKRKQGEKLSTF